MKRPRSPTPEDTADKDAQLQGEAKSEVDSKRMRSETTPAETGDDTINGVQNVKNEASGDIPDSMEKVFEFVHQLALNPYAKLEEFSKERNLLLQYRDVLYAGPEKRSKKKENGRSRSRRSMNIDRPSSPSLFGKESNLELLSENISGQKRKNPCSDLNNMLSAVRNRFYVKNYKYDSPLSLMKSSIVVPTGEKNNKTQHFRAVQRHSTLGSLVSPIAQDRIEDNWSPKEISLFESGICTYGKHFHVIKRLLKNKTTKEVVQFYYVWKKSDNYAIWKKSQQKNNF
mmetsp:Transcript_2913/g.3944  ORF Transcript_2913/g.3944 Transcript_2913/m.3944 type:complete len:285 (-) Transcript_2913:359-1213(-)|eukprot:CAMPEP_0184012356 /NCGR_PEP_ID=MMETSP0954-20121128/4355_1 /TAXON_ID=627963 /ORGANISM="Aplanochytrium sp, Strain PBS07" /LENGTH=284 /DNA_ID=CAMNT_0026292311 /DNA_START=62 /DNA_END=916 /DNA_ORIENTATION=+